MLHCSSIVPLALILGLGLAPVRREKLGTRSVENVSFQTRIRHSRMVEVLFSFHPKPFHNPNPWKCCRLAQRVLAITTSGK